MLLKASEKSSDQEKLKHLNTAGVFHPNDSLLADTKLKRQRKSVSVTGPHVGKLNSMHKICQI